ncbi:F-box/FBD/LRR-repeat protein At1g13570-like [Carex rostrata]
MAARRFQASGSGIDFLSNLPEPVKVKILALVPLKEAVRTSVLSKRWRQTWFGIPSLIIHEEELGVQSLTELIELVDHLLFSHTDSIDKFELVVAERRHRFSIEEDLDVWINTLLRKHVHELVLNLGYAPLDIPSRIFSLPDLEALHLRGCKINNMPKNFHGFKWVHTLKFENIGHEGTEIERLVSGCPLLTHFLLVTDQMFDDLTIRSPNLLELKIIAEFKELHLETPKLVTLFASLTEGFLSEVQSKYKNNISRLMCYLPEIQKLHMYWNFVRYLGSGGVPAQLPVNISYLTELVIEIDCAFSEHIDVVLCLLRSAPKLRNLYIELNNEENNGPPYTSHWEEAGAIECQLNQLQTVKIGGELLDLHCIVAFVKFVLRSAPILEEVRMKNIAEIEGMHVGTKFLLELLKLPRLSNKAVINMI